MARLVLGVGMVSPLDDRYSRQVLFAGVGPEGQQRLRAATAVLVGCGALGTVVASYLVRAGIGRLRIVDRDYVEESNLQRQLLFDEEDARLALPKAVAAVEKLRRANSEVQAEAVVEDLGPDNAERLIGAADVVLDGTDNFETRYIINDACVKLGRSWVYAAAVAAYGVVMPVVPGRSACLRCIFPEQAPTGAFPTCDTAGILGPIAGMVGSIAAVEAIKLLVGAHDRLSHGLTWIDLWNNTYQRAPVDQPVPGCSTCQLGRFDFLTMASAGHTAVLCGRNAVQVRPIGRGSVDLTGLAERLEASLQVKVNPYLLRFAVGEYELTVFADGRAIVKGTDDIKVARSLYARYIGT